MQHDKILRQIDELGRVCIPKDVRLELGIECGDKIAISTEGNKIILTSPMKRCIFCGSKYELVDYNDKLVCSECIRFLRTVKDI